MWFGLISKYYRTGLWTAEQVEHAVTLNKITEDEYFQITGKKYGEEEVAESVTEVIEPEIVE